MKYTRYIHTEIIGIFLSVVYFFKYFCFLKAQLRYPTFCLEPICLLSCPVITIVGLTLVFDERGSTKEEELLNGSLLEPLRGSTMLSDTTTTRLELLDDVDFLLESG